MKVVFWDILTLIIIVLILMIGGIYAMIFFNPGVGINPLPPAALPPILDIKIPTNTATLRSLPNTWTPEGGAAAAASGPTLRPTRTLTPTITRTPTDTVPPTITLSPTMSRTVDPTLVTYTPTITPSHSATLTLNAPLATSKAKTQSAAQTADAIAAKTAAAQREKDNYALSLTEMAGANQATRDAYSLQLTAQAQALTWTAAPQQTIDAALNRTAAAKTNAQATVIAAQNMTAAAKTNAQATAVAAAAQTQAAVDTAAAKAKLTADAAVAQTQAAVNATNTSGSATANAVKTQAVQATHIQQAPIAISVDLDGAAGLPYEYIETYLLLGVVPPALPSPPLSSLFLQDPAEGVPFPNAGEISSWWLDDNDGLWYLMLSDNNLSRPLNLVHYLDVGGTSDINTTGGGGDLTHPIVSTQLMAAADSWVVFTELGAGGDHDLWQVRGDGTNLGTLTTNDDLDDHDPSWTPDGRILYASGPAVGSDNLYLLNPGSTPPGTKLTNNNAGSVEIASPKMCHSWDWANEKWRDTIVFASRTSSSFKWDIWTADPSDWTNTLKNITDSPDYNETDPDWSPYCEQIVYVLSGVPGDTPDVHVMARDGTYIQRVTDDTNLEYNPLWRPVLP